MAGRRAKDLDEALQEIKAAVESSPKKSKRVLVKTLVRACGFAVRTKERMALISEKLAAMGVSISPSLEEVDREDWVTLTLMGQPPVPVFTGAAAASASETPDPWFDELQTKTFESEKEVEIRFILPLLERLGYSENDRADGYPVEIYEGVRKMTKEADFVLFDGQNRSKDNALLVIEAKAVGRRVHDYIGQARTYAIWLGTPYYMVTNAEEVKVFLFRSAIQSDVEVFSSTRQGLKSAFKNLYTLISKPAIVEYKAKRRALTP